MQTTTINRQRTRSSKHDRFHVTSRTISKTENPGMSFASRMVALVALFILMIACVGGLRAYTANLDVSVNNKKVEMNLIDERINELQGEIDALFGDSLNVSLNCNADYTPECSFVHDLWEVGG
ncbi:hypothetical protein J7L05_02165 [bacterium]|nr:hypothetical protein [bacterium]